MVKLKVLKPFRNAENLQELFEVGQVIEVSSERAEDIKSRLHGFTEEVKARKAPVKKTTRKPKEDKQEDDQ